jgi:membrane protein involved in colicin uptake
MATENPLAPGATEGGTSETTGTPQEQAENKLLQEWDEQIAKMEEGKISGYEIDALFYKINELAPQLVKAGKKTEPEITEEFYKALQILGLKKLLHPSDLAVRKDAFNRALSPEKYAAYDQEAQQFEQEAYQQSLAAEQQRKIEEELKKFRQEMEAKEALAQEKRDKSEKQIQAALMLAKEQGKISEEKARNLEMRALAATAASSKALTQKLDTTMSAKEKEARDKFTKTIQQTPAAAKKLAAEQKAASEQGIFSKAIKLVTDTASNLWYGSTTPTTTSSQGLTQLEKEQELKDLKIYLASITTKQPDEIKIIVELWEKLQKALGGAAQAFNQNNTDKWITVVSMILKELVLTHHIISIEDACTKVKNALPLPSAGQDYRKDIVNKIKIYLDEAEWKQRTEKQQAEAKKMEILKQKQEQAENIKLTQQKIKNEEDRIKAEEKKQLLAVASYKDEKQQWKQLLAQLAQNKQATPKENNAQTLEAIKKSHSLFNLARVIPAKNEHSVLQKLKQKFTVALLEQQKPNENKINIHHNMDQFNKSMNKLLE